jgi:hypothetical protein
MAWPRKGGGVKAPKAPKVHKSGLNLLAHHGRTASTHHGPGGMKPPKMKIPHIPTPKSHTPKVGAVKNGGVKIPHTTKALHPGKGAPPIKKIP